MDGALGSTGCVDAALVRRFEAHPFFALRPPKSLDRDAFRSVDGWLRDARLSLVDGAATLAAMTAAGVAASVAWMPQRPALWVVAGGGRRNQAILAALRARLGAEVQVRTADEVGWDGDALEAEAFAFLAVRSARHWPFSFPTTTGVPAPVVGGRRAEPMG